MVQKMVLVCIAICFLVSLWTSINENFCVVIFGDHFNQPGFFVCRQFLSEEQNMEIVLMKAFLEIDKAYAGHARLSADGRYKVYSIQAWKGFYSLGESTY